MRRLQSITTLTAAVVLTVLAAAVFVMPDTDQEFTARFSSATGLYKGDDVRVVGIKVGEIKSIDPDGATVKVRFSVDADQPVPREAKAAIVAPSLVNGRFIQLAPAYTSGAKLGDGDAIPLARTAVPVSFDEVKKELTDLSTALGPKGDDPGSLRRAVKTVDAQLGGGTAKDLRTTITAMRRASGTLADGRGDLFSTIKELNSFTRNLVAHDSAVRDATRELDGFSGVLDDNKEQLARTIKLLRQALGKVGSFVKENTGELSTTARRSVKLTDALADESNTLAQALHAAPNAAEGLYNSVDQSAVSGRVALSNLDSVAQLLCGAVLGSGGSVTQCRSALQPLLKVLGVDSVPVLKKPPSAPGKPSASDSLNDLSRSLGGLLGGGQQGSRPSQGLLDVLGGGPHED